MTKGLSRSRDGAGEALQATFEAIYQNWPKSDAAAAAFAKQYGVDTPAEP